MATSEPQLDRNQQRQMGRFHRMGLSARAMPGGRSLLVSLPLSSAPFESVKGPLSIERIIFSTVGANRIKCLRPRPVFGLPLLDIRKCADAAAVEAMIRQAWRERTNELRATGRLLKSIGIEVSAIEGGSVLAFPLPGEIPDARVLMQRVGEAILPSNGPLTGITLESPEDRVLEVSDALDSGSDLECLIGAGIQSRLREENSRPNKSNAPTSAIIHRPTILAKPTADKMQNRHQPKVLLVGIQVIKDAELREELTRQGYLAATARSESEALARLAGMTPDLIISQYGLGRSDGATLVQATRALPGIERIPVILLDDSHHPGRREAARAVGAAGYLVKPKNTGRFVDRLKPIIEMPGDRRFTRYPHRLAARLEGSESPCLATEVGRGGIFLATKETAAHRSAMNCEITLPELGRALHFGGEVLYTSEAQGGHLRGLGLRIFDISQKDEASLIEYLAWLESSR